MSAYVETTCPTSKRVDDPTKHSTRFDGDDPYTVCVYCGETRDARTGRIVRAASQQQALTTYGTVATTNAPEQAQ